MQCTRRCSSQRFFSTRSFSIHSNSHLTLRCSDLYEITICHKAVLSPCFHAAATVSTYEHNTILSPSRQYLELWRHYRSDNVIAFPPDKPLAWSPQVKLDTFPQCTLQGVVITESLHTFLGLSSQRSTTSSPSACTRRRTANFRRTPNPARSAM